MPHRYLAKFDRLIDHAHLSKVERSYRAVFGWLAVDELPYTWSDMPPIADEDWPDIPYNDTFADRELMLLQQLRPPFLHLQARDYHPVAIRANFGTVILPTILGASFQLTETSMPWAHHLLDRDAIRRTLDAGVPDPSAGLGGACLDMAAYYRKALAPYPGLVQATVIYHPDLQGPFDVAHLLWGPDIFLALYDCPDLVHALLDLVTRTYIAWLTHWKQAVGEGNEFTTHWSYMMRGGAMLRDDTSVMLSGGQYEEFVKPYDQRVLDIFGGCIHFCGRGDQFIGPMLTSRNLYGINCSQPDLNDMTRMWQLTRKHRVVLLGLQAEYLPPDAHTGVTLVRSWKRARLS